MGFNNVRSFWRVVVLLEVAGKDERRKSKIAFTPEPSHESPKPSFTYMYIYWGFNVLAYPGFMKESMFLAGLRSL